MKDVTVNISEMNRMSLAENYYGLALNSFVEMIYHNDHKILNLDSETVVKDTIS